MVREASLADDLDDLSSQFDGVESDLKFSVSISDVVGDGDFGSDRCVPDLVAGSSGAATPLRLLDGTLESTLESSFSICFLRFCLAMVGPAGLPSHGRYKAGKVHTTQGDWPYGAGERSINRRLRGTTVESEVPTLFPS